MANYFIAKTAIGELPFITHFNTGSGKFFSVDGNVVSEQSWNNRSMQDILPTWRWLIEGGQDVNVGFDWDNAYYGGSSLKLSGEINADKPTHIKLYKTNLPIQENTEISLTYKTNLKDPNMKLGVSFTNNPDQFVFFDVKNKEQHQWVTDSFKLKAYNDKRIKAISLLVDSDQEVVDFTTNIGEIKIHNKSGNQSVVHSPKNAKITNVELKACIFADVKLDWEQSDSRVGHYEVYRKLSNNKKEFVGATPNQVYYISDLKRKNKESSTDLEIVAVNKRFERSKPTTVTFDWPVELKDLRESIENLHENGEIVDENTIHALTSHVTAIEHFYHQNKLDKVIKHLNGFNLLLDGLVNKEQVSDKAHQLLSQQAKKLIEQYRNRK